jgi:hypothetical protein
MRRIKLVVALAAAMVVLMMSAAVPAMADGFRLRGDDGDGLRSFTIRDNGNDNDIGDDSGFDLDDLLSFSIPGFDIFGLNNNGTDIGDLDIDSFNFDNDGNIDIS